MIFSCGLAVLSFLPAVAIVPVLHFLPVVKDHAAVFRPEKHKRTELGGERKARGPAATPGELPGFQGAGEPLVMSVKGNQVGSDLLQEGRAP